MQKQDSEISGRLWYYFNARAQSWLERPAVTTARETMTFRQLFASADEMSAALRHEGVREGYVIGLALPNSLAFIPAFLALCKLGASVALVSPKYGTGELQAICDGLRPDGVLTTAGLAGTSPYRDLGTVTTTLQCATEAGDLALVSSSTYNQTLPRSGALANTAVIKFSSGSTGTPKGIVLCPGNLLAEARNVAVTLSLSPVDRILVAVPMFHSYGFDLGVLAILVSGASLVLQDCFVPRRVLSEAREQRITVFLGVPAMYRTLVETRLSSVPDLTGVRYLLSCTAPLTPDLISEFHSKFRVPICQHYGSSETGAITTHIPAEVMRRSSSVGTPMDGVELRIVDEKGETLSPGMEGEVVVSGAAVAKGYIMGIPAGDGPFRRGAYWTGDLGVLDDAGFLHLRGRMDRIINVGGMKVSPQEVVQVLEAFPAVREGVVVGVKDRTGEEGVYAAVTLRDKATETEILSFCRTRLADYKVPRRIKILSEMPRTAMGKINLKSEQLRL